MTMPFNPVANGAPAPGQQSFPMPPGQATFQAPVPGQPTQITREGPWQGYPASALPPIPQPQPQTQPGPAPVPQYGAAPLYPNQQSPQYQPGMPVPTQHAQPQTQPGQQFVPQQPQQPPQQIPAGIDPNTILQGPQFPPELQGVTLGQAINLYGGMRNLVLGLQQRAQQQHVPQQQVPQPQPQQQPQQQPGQQPPAFDWRNPAPGIAAIVGQLLDDRLAPVTQQAALQGAATARNVVAQELGVHRFAQLEPVLMQYLQGATPQDLANPELWRVAARTALGEMALRGQQTPQQMQPAAQPYGGATPFRPGMQNPAPPLQSFFTETPQAGAQVQTGVTLSPAEMWFADQMGVAYNDYAAYKGGVPPILPAGGRR
jgi:hypothetical protein